MLTRKLLNKESSWKEGPSGSIMLKINNLSVRVEGQRGVITSLEVEEEEGEVDEVDSVDVVVEEEEEEEGKVEIGDRGISSMEVINGSNIERSCCEILASNICNDIRTTLYSFRLYRSRRNRIESLQGFPREER